MLVVKVPSEPARHRIAVWRELRKAGAVILGAGVWALPDLPALTPVLTRLDDLVARADGDLLRLRATGHDEPDSARLGRLYAEARGEEWAEFVRDCAKYLAELEREHRRRKYTLAELEEEEQSLDRLRRWYRELRVRDLLGTPGTGEGDLRLKECADAFERFAEAVHVALGQAGP